MFNNLMSKIINKYGSIETTTTEATKQFVERLGFKEISRNEFKINYIKTEV